MKAAHEMAESSGAMPGFDHELDGPLALEDFQPVLAKRAPENQTERRASFVRYLAAIYIGIVGTLAWHSYGEATKQTAATTASEHAAQVKHSASGPGPMVLSMPRFLLLSRCPRRTR